MEEILRYGQCLPVFAVLMLFAPAIAFSGPIDSDTGKTSPDPEVGDAFNVDPKAQSRARGAFATQGVGRLSCERFLREREAGSKLYWNIGGWIDGFLSGYNAYVPDTFDITAYAPLDSADSFVVLLARHCRNNERDPIAHVVKSIADQLHPIRLKKPSEIVAIKVNGENKEIYGETILMVQKALKRLDHYEDRVDGTFGPNTKRALIMFQRDQGISETGEPNSDTLLRLLFTQISDQRSAD